jgi:Pyridoxamine 5'-phosphate oxidase
LAPDPDRPALDRTEGSTKGTDPAEPLSSEVLAFLDVHRDVVLFCRDKSERPIGYPMRTVACHDSGVTFTTYRKSAKVRNIERDPRVCVVATDRDGTSVRWVSVSGTARVVAPSDAEIEDIFGTAGTGDGAEGRVPGGMGEFVKERLRDGKRILIEVEYLEASAVQAGQLM